MLRAYDNCFHSYGFTRERQACEWVSESERERVWVKELMEIVFILWNVSSTMFVYYLMSLLYLSTLNALSFKTSDIFPKTYFCFLVSEYIQLLNSP